METLLGRVAIVTGAARGIGAAQARALAAHGASVILADVRPEGRAIADDIGERALFVDHDVTDEAAWTGLSTMVLERFGRIDILVNTAGIVSPPMSLAQTSAATFIDVFRVNALGMFLGMKAVAEPMVAARSGAIINVISSSVFHGADATYPYAASKWAARGLSKAAAKELSRSGIRVNAIFPGPVDTGLLRELGLDPEQVAAAITPAGFAAQPRDIANATVFLASDEARYVYGAELTVDGGHAI